MPLIVVFQLDDQDLIIHRLVDDPMLIGDPPGPITGQRMLQWFRFPESLVRRTDNILDDQIDPLQHLLVGLLPIQVIFPRLR